MYLSFVFNNLILSTYDYNKNNQKQKQKRAFAN